jgi:hypothetical protein
MNKKLHIRTRTYKNKNNTNLHKNRNHSHKQKKAWGYHLIVDAAHCDPDAIRSKKTIAAFARELVKEIKMVAFGAPQIHRFGCGRLEGYTMIQLIETSNISAHFDEYTNAVYLDVFSCKAFDQHVALEVFNKYFTPEQNKVRFLKRQA